MHRLSVRRKHILPPAKEIVIEFNTRFQLRAMANGQSIRLVEEGREYRIFTGVEFQQDARSCLQELALCLSQQLPLSRICDANFVIPLDSALLVIEENGDFLRVSHHAENDSECVNWKSTEFAKDPVTVILAAVAAIGLFQRSNLDAFFGAKTTPDKTKKDAKTAL